MSVNAWSGRLVVKVTPYSAMPSCCDTWFTESVVASMNVWSMTSWSSTRSWVYAEELSGATSIASIDVSSAFQFANAAAVSRDDASACWRSA